MLRRVALVMTDVLEERFASIIRIRIDELETNLAVTSNRSKLRGNTVVPSSPILVTLTTETVRSYKTSVLARTTPRHMPKDGINRSHRRENLKFSMVVAFFSALVTNKKVLRGL
jgi:hypothetical protein